MQQSNTNINLQLTIYHLNNTHRYHIFMSIIFIIAQLKIKRYNNVPVTLLFNLGKKNLQKIVWTSININKTFGKENKYKLIK